MSDSSSRNVLEVKDLTFRYDREAVLSGLSFTLSRGDVLLLTGASGTGKSTLLRVLARLLEPESGSILLEGQPWHALEAATYRRRVAYLQQQPVMTDGSVRDNLLLSYRFGGGDTPGEDHLAALLEETALSDVSLDKDATELSVGQQQRIALLRLLMMKPDMLLLDEPTASIDAEAARQLMRMVASEHTRAKRAVLFVSHNHADTDLLSPRIAVLRNGRIEEDA